MPQGINVECTFSIQQGRTNAKPNGRIERTRLIAISVLRTLIGSALILQEK